MESDCDEKIHQWINQWNDLANFEVIPVMSFQHQRQQSLPPENNYLISK